MVEMRENMEIFLSPYLSQKLSCIVKVTLWYILTVELNGGNAWKYANFALSLFVTKGIMYCKGYPVIHFNSGVE